MVEHRGFTWTQRSIRLDLRLAIGVLAVVTIVAALGVTAKGKIALAVPADLTRPDDLAALAEAAVVRTSKGNVRRGDSREHRFHARVRRRAPRCKGSEQQGDRSATLHLAGHGG